MNSQRIGLIFPIIMAGLAALLIFNGVRYSLSLSRELGDINVELITEANPPKAGEATKLKLLLRDREGNPVRNLKVGHERLVHVVVVGENFDVFGHIHPEDFGSITKEMIKNGEYNLEFIFPAAGRYLLGFDMETFKESFAKNLVIEVKGEPGLSPVIADLRQRKCFVGYKEMEESRYVLPISFSESEARCPLGYEVALLFPDGVVKAGQKTRLGFHIENEGRPVKDLSLYLGAPLHVTIVPESFDSLVHEHGSGVDIENLDHEEDEAHSFLQIPVAEAHVEGPESENISDSDVKPDLITNYLVFPKPGNYHIFGQFRHQDQIIFSKFTLAVE